MSPTNPNLVEIAGRYVVCDGCHAPEVDPVPERWLLTVRGRAMSRMITFHLPTCPKLKSVREGGKP